MHQRRHGDGDLNVWQFCNGGGLSTLTAQHGTERNMKKQHTWRTRQSIQGKAGRTGYHQGLNFERGVYGFMCLMI